MGSEEAMLQCRNIWGSVHRERKREEAFGVAISDSIRSMGTRHGHPVLHSYAYYSRTMMVVLLIMRPRLSPFEHNEKARVAHLYHTRWLDRHRNISLFDNFGYTKTK